MFWVLYFVISENIFNKTPMNTENNNIFYTPVVDEKNVGIRIDKFAFSMYTNTPIYSRTWVESPSSEAFLSHQINPISYPFAENQCL